MRADYLVKERSNDECSDLAKRARAWFGQGDAQYLDVCKCLTKGEVLTVYGIRRLVLRIRPDEEMGKDDAVTNFADGAITIAIQQSCWDRSKRNHGRSRQTLAHELGHAVQGHAEMRADKPMARRQGAAGKYISAENRPSTTRSAEGLHASKSAEHQAKVFAPAFLINDRIAETLSSAKEIALAFGISLTSAEIYYEQLVKRRNKQKSAERVRQIADETIAILAVRKPVSVKYVTEACPACGMRTVLPSDSRFKCDTCKKAFDFFQDGDAVDF
jgi:hypothetical protein